MFSIVPRIRLLSTLALGLLATAAAPSAGAVETYVSAGFPFVVIGVAQAISPSFAVRADYGTIGRRDYSFTTDDNDFKGNVHYGREALLGDWYVAGGGFHLTGGATINQAKATVRASSHNGTITLGGVTYSAPSAQYYLQSDVSMPKVMPYVGIGWGHHEKAESGFTFNVDVGASIGKAKATTLTASPALQSELGSSGSGQSDLNNANQDFQHEVSKVKAMPQLTLGVGYRF